jgi:hypothetical protein
MPLNPRVVLSVRPVIKRAGVRVEDCLPWEDIRLDSFSTMDDVSLPEPQSFGVLEDGDEAWPELEEWLCLNPDEPEDLPLDFLPGMNARRQAFRHLPMSAYRPRG